MVTNDTDRLLARYFAGELSPQDRIRLEKWLAESQEHEEYFFELTSIYQNMGTGEYPPFDVQKAIEIIEEHINKTSLKTLSHKRKPLAWIIGAAAAVMAGADFLCYLTPAEHLTLPNKEDVLKFSQIGAVDKQEKITSSRIVNVALAVE